MQRQLELQSAHHASDLSDDAPALRREEQMRVPDVSRVLGVTFPAGIDDSEWVRSEKEELDSLAALSFRMNPESVTPESETPQKNKEAEAKSPEEGEKVKSPEEGEKANSKGETEKEAKVNEQSVDSGSKEDSGNEVKEKQVNGSSNDETKEKPISESKEDSTKESKEKPISNESVNESKEDSTKESKVGPLDESKEKPMNGSSNDETNEQSIDEPINNESMAKSSSDRSVNESKEKPTNESSNGESNENSSNEHSMNESKEKPFIESKENPSIESSKGLHAEPLSDPSNESTAQPLPASRDASISPTQAGCGVESEASSSARGGRPANATPSSVQAADPPPSSPLQPSQRELAGLASPGERPHESARQEPPVSSTPISSLHATEAVPPSASQ